MGTGIRVRGARLSAELRSAIQRLDWHNTLLKVSDQDLGTLTLLQTLQGSDLFLLAHDPGTGTMSLFAIQYSALLDQLGDDMEVNWARWKPAPASSYTATPASASRLTMSSTGLMAKGLPISFLVAETRYYAQVTAVSPNAYIDVRGAPLSGAVSDLMVGNPELVSALTLFVPGAYGDGVADLMNSDAKRLVRWEGGAACLVGIDVRHYSDDTGANQPKVNVKVDGSLVSTADSGDGLTVGTAWTDNGVETDTAAYDVGLGDALDVRCTAAGSNGDANSLTVSLAFVVK